jgi:hypothetical protein
MNSAAEAKVGTCSESPALPGALLRGCVNPSNLFAIFKRRIFVKSLMQLNFGYIHATVPFCAIVAVGMLF